MVAFPKSISLLLLAAFLAGGCARQHDVVVVGKAEFPGQVSFIAEGNLLGGYDLSILLSYATHKRVAKATVYCTLDTPADATSYLKGYEVKGSDIVLSLTDDTSCGESVDGKLIGGKRIEVSAPGR
jgi:hypothetical protein